MTSILNLCHSKGSAEIAENYCLLTQVGDLLSPARIGAEAGSRDGWVIIALTSPCLLTDLQASDLWRLHHLHVWVGGYTVGSLKTRKGFLEMTLPGTPFHEVESCSQIQDSHRFFSGKTRWKGLNLGLPPTLKEVNQFSLVIIKILWYISDETGSSC